MTNATQTLLMFDSLLYGYGLTLALSQKLSNLAGMASWRSQILSFESFFRSFITSAPHQRIYKDFLSYFNINRDSALLHENTKAELASRVDEILSCGFERWVSKNLFSTSEEVDSEKRFYMYFLYNYWAHVIFTQILRSATAQKLLDEAAEKIAQKLRNTELIFTTNFDTFLDEYLHPQHLHGVFSLPLTSVRDVVLNYRSEEKFEYVYLFGTNGFEKKSRLEAIHQLKQQKYELDFFYDSQLDLGHLLIYGLSFGNTEFISEDFLAEYPRHEPQYLIRSVDGHIILRLNEKFRDNKLKKVTIGYYNDNDLKHLHHMFSMTDLRAIIDFKSSSEIFPI